MATSLYNSRNEDVAPELVKILMESETTIPDFLQGEMPADGKLEFDDDTGDEDEEGGDDGGWGGNGNADDGAGGWGAPAADDGGWGAPAPAAAPEATDGGWNGGDTGADW